MYRVTSNLQQKFWNNKLAMESVVADPFEMFAGTYNDQKKAMPNGIMTHVDLKGKRTGVMSLLKRLSGAPTTGRDTLLGNERDQDTRELLVYANEVRAAVNSEQYGIDANEKSPYKLLEAIQPQLSMYLSEIKGMYKRQALVEKFSDNLTDAPVSQTQLLNENILIKGEGINDLVYQDQVSNAAFIELLGDLMEAGGNATTSIWDAKFLSRIQYWATVLKKIVPMDNGRYVLMVPSRQAAFLKDPSSTTSLFGVFKSSAIEDLVRKWGYDQYLGSFGQMDMFEDPRAPILEKGGSNSSWTVTAKYKGAGDDDDRASTSGDVFDCGFILGKGALIESEFEAPHFEDEVQDYNMIKGIGVATGIGYQRTVYHDIAGSETRSKTINQSSGMILAFAGDLDA